VRLCNPIQGGRQLCRRHQKALLKYFDYQLDQVKISKCRDKLRASWPSVQRDAAHVAISCFPSRFVDNGNGTVTDNLTALQWEQKSDDGSIHDKDPHSRRAGRLVIARAAAALPRRFRS
jgi:hypothetical protein